MYRCKSKSGSQYEFFPRKQNWLLLCLPIQTGSKPHYLCERAEKKSPSRLTNQENYNYLSDLPSKGFQNHI